MEAAFCAVTFVTVDFILATAPYFKGSFWIKLARCCCVNWFGDASVVDSVIRRYKSMFYIAAFPELTNAELGPKLLRG